MSDSYWRYADARQQQAAAALQIPVAKRPRPDYDVPGGQELPNYYAHEDERAARVIRDTDPIGASYDRYLRSSQMPSYPGNESARGMSSGHPVDDPRVLGLAGSDPVLGSKGRSMAVGGGGGGRSELALPPDASSTLFVEGLPSNCTRREVSHIFRPFVGYKEVRLVTKESRHQSGGDALVLCFVDFVSPAHAATAMDPLQGYKFDEHDRDSPRLRLQFARHPGARSGGGHRGKR